MKTTRLAVFAFAALAFALPASPAMAGSTSPGKNSVYVSDFSLTTAEFPNNTLTGTIVKGKKGTVLEIHTMISAYAGEPTHLIATVTVNGFPSEPTFEGSGWISGQDCRANNSIGCTLTETRWLDIDAAEAAHPGVYVGQPLVISYLAGVQNGFGDGVIGSSTLTVNVQKK
jgi:hypothetical protein